MVTGTTEDLPAAPDTLPDSRISVRDVFGLDLDLEVGAFSEPSQFVPVVDPHYRFDPDTTRAILAGFDHNRRVMVQGYHGTGKSSHIEQVAARLNWPCLRVNLDGQVSRVDLLGKDAIVLKDRQQVTQFREGILPWALQRPVALVLDEYDAGRPEVMFVLQRVLESDGKLTLLAENRVIHPHPSFRMFATTNTIGMGDDSGLYAGVQQINQAQMDRWNIVTTLNYVEHDTEMAIVIGKNPRWNIDPVRNTISCMVSLAALTRQGFLNGDISAVMSPRTVINWAENTEIFGDVAFAFRVTFFNKCEASEQPIINEYYQRCMGHELHNN